MAKININFNETNYAIDEANLAPATDALKAHLGTLGSGGDTLKYEKEAQFKDVITLADFEAYVSAGAEFVVALTGSIMTLPGLGKTPAAYGIDVDDNGVITGLF